MKAASRAHIDPFAVMEVVAAARSLDEAHHDVLHLEVGQPSTGAPARAVTAALARLNAGDPLGYTEAAGLPALRKAIAQRYRHRHGTFVHPERVVVTVGASGACVLAMLAAFDSGDRVLVTRPGYPCYRQMLHAFDVRVTEIPVGTADRFRLTAAHLDAVASHGDAVRGVVLASPANPTGTVMVDDELASVSRWCSANEAWLISDEIYHGITFERAAATAVASPNAIVLGSFSKYFSMTGWRLGWMVVPEVLIEAVDRLQQNLFLCPPALAQHAALAVFDGDATLELDGHVDRYRRNRDRFIAALHTLGITETAPADGAFYVYADTSPWHPDSRELCRTWLTELHLAATPGVDFDGVDGHRWVRFSMSGTEQTIDDAVERLTAWRSVTPPRDGSPQDR